MSAIRMLVGALAFLSTASTFSQAGEQLIVCGGEEVFIIPADVTRPTEKDRLWRWRAADSPEIPADMRKKFRTTDECKPVKGDALLITSSSGGVALVRQRDKKCLFYTSATNAHSACLLPGRRVAVASSYGGNELLVFDLDHPGASEAPLARMQLYGAHGVVWDAQRERLWALGTKELLLVDLRGRGTSTELTVDKRLDLPTPGGHDLSPCRDGRHLFVTTKSHVYQFDTKAGRFAPQPGLADQPRVKSVDQHSTTGRVVFHQATEEHWWSDSIRFLAPSTTIQLPGERIYKVRWNVSR